MSIVSKLQEIIARKNPNKKNCILSNSKLGNKKLAKVGIIFYPYHYTEVEILLTKMNESFIIMENNWTS